MRGYPILSRKKVLQKIQCFLGCSFFEKRKRKARIFSGTLSILKEGTLNGETFSFEKAVDACISYCEIPQYLKSKGSVNGFTEIEVIKSALLDVTCDLAKAEYKPMAVYSFHPFRALLSKVPTKEIFLRTNLSLVLDCKLGFQKKKIHPFSLYGGIYTPHVWILREGEEKSYRFLKNPQEISMFCSVPIYSPHLEKRSDREWWFAKSDEELMKMKIRMQLHVACHQKHDAIVIGPFGSEYCNPLHHVAKLYLQLIEKEFYGKIKRVTFAIWGEGKRRLFNPRGNFKPFAESVDGSGVVIP